MFDVANNKSFQSFHHIYSEYLPQWAQIVFMTSNRTCDHLSNLHSDSLSEAENIIASNEL